MNNDQPILTISVAAKLLELHIRTIMAYEKAGLLSPHRTKTKRRMFSVADLNDLQFLKYLSFERKLNIAGIKTILEAIRVAKGHDLDLQKTLFPDFRLRSLL